MSRIKTTALVGLLFALPGAAFAQSASGKINVTATVKSSCSITDGAFGIIGLNFTKLSAGVATGSVDPSGKTATYANTACNVPTHVSLKSSFGGAVGGDYTGDPNHQNFFDYTAVASFNGASVTLDTAGLTKGQSSATITSTSVSNGPFTGNLTVLVTPEAGAHRLVVGTYNDSITVTLTAN